MDATRTFDSRQHLQPSDDEPIRSVVTTSADATVVAWHVKPGQRIAAHVHPEGQDTWTVLSGGGDYLLNATGRTRRVAAGDIAVARRGEVHGVLATGDEPLVFISVVCPAQAGYELR